MCLREGRYAAIFHHPAGARVIGGERVGDIPEGIELGGNVAGAAPEIVHDIVAVDAHVRRGTGHELGQAIGADGALGGDAEPAFLLDERLEEAAPLGRGKPGPGHPWCGGIFSRDPDDHHLDGLTAFAEETAVHRARIHGRIDARGRETGMGFERCDVETRSRDGCGHLFEDAKLLGLDLGKLITGRRRVPLHAEILAQGSEERDELADPGIVLGWYALRECGWREAAERGG